MTLSLFIAPANRRPEAQCSSCSGKLPKNYEVNGYVDPERWLPRRERSYYKGKRRDKRKEIGEVTILFSLRENR